VYAPRPRQLAAEIGRLRGDPAALAAMRDSSVRAGRPDAAADIARFLADLAGPAGAGASAARLMGRGGLPGEPALLPALVGGAAAQESALLLSMTETGGAKRVRVTSSFRRVSAASSRRLRRSGVLIRAALRDR
jgi:hypothetical protein